MALIDKIVGSIFIAIGSIVFGYYTLWAMIMPFVPKDAAIQSFFLPRKYAVILPFALLVIGLTGIIGYLVLSNKLANKKKEKST